MRPTSEADKKFMLDLLTWRIENGESNDPEWQRIEAELSSYLWRIHGIRVECDDGAEEMYRDWGNQVSEGLDWFPEINDPHREVVIISQLYDRQFLLVRGFMLLEAAGRFASKRLMAAGAGREPWDEKTGKLSSRIRDLVCQELRGGNRNDECWDTLDLLCEVRNRIIHEFTSRYDAKAESQKYSQRCKKRGILWHKSHGHLILDEGVDLIESTFKNWVRFLIKEAV